ncbi:hypothetical protein AB0C93_33575 [Streptomyces sp. NPDC048518]|uniref:zinc finger domain-containing protein n=1 Tax=Streptomyces sp. NPDC048518 TaxID=3155029 RepID=UPI003401DD86
MQLTPDQAANAVERHDCPKCELPAGSPCRTRGGKTTTKHRTARFILVPALREETAAPARPIRIGYARCSTATQELQSQLDARAEAEQKAEAAS